MRDIDLDALLPKLVKAFFETLHMVMFSFVFATIIGILIGIVLYATRKGNILQNAVVFGVLSFIINLVRPIPFIIFIVAMIPLTRIIVGTSIGPGAAILTLSIVGGISIGRIAETNLVAVDPGTIEAGSAMGARPLRVLFTIVLPEAIGPLILGLTYIFVALIDATAVAGIVGAGGLGSLALTYGYQRFDTFVMLTVIVVLIVMVQVAQFLGNWIARKAMH